MDFEGTFHTVRRVFTDPVQHGRFCYDLRRILHQQLEDRIFCAGEADRKTAYFHSVSICIHSYLIIGQYGGGRGWGGSLSKLDRDPGKQLLCIEWFCDIV